MALVICIVEPTDDILFLISLRFAIFYYITLRSLSLVVSFTKEIQRAQGFFTFYTLLKDHSQLMSLHQLFRP